MQESARVTRQKNSGSSWACGKCEEKTGKEHVIIKTDEDLMRELVHFLEPFHQVTKALEEVPHPLPI